MAPDSQGKISSCHVHATWLYPLGHSLLILTQVGPIQSSLLKLLHLDGKTQSLGGDHFIQAVEEGSVSCTQEVTTPSPTTRASSLWRNSCGGFAFQGHILIMAEQGLNREPQVGAGCADAPCALGLPPRHPGGSSAPTDSGTRC